MNAINLLIGGKDRPAAQDAVYQRSNPISGEVASTVAAASVEDAMSAADAAAAAFPAWSALGPNERRARLNKALQRAMEANPPVSKKGKRLKLFFATQVSTQPPTIVVKCNDPKLLDDGWKRYLLGFLQEQLPFKEVPIRLYFRGKGEKDEKPTEGTKSRTSPSRRRTGNPG